MFCQKWAQNEPDNTICAHFIKEWRKRYPKISKLIQEMREAKSNMTETFSLILSIVEIFIMMLFVFMIGVKSVNSIQKYIDTRIDAKLAQLKKNE